MYESQTFDVILKRMLDRVSSSLDKREGSIIYDVAAPAANELQNAYINLDIMINEAYADTASRYYLIKRAAERGLLPYSATKAIVKGEFNTNVPIRARFSLEDLNYIVREKISEHIFKLERSRNGGNYVKVGDSLYSNTNSISNYTGYISYAQPGDLFRFRVRAYDFFDISSAWSVYGTFEIQQSGINYPVGEQWKGHYVYAAVNGTWTLCQVFTVQKNQWAQCIMQ